MKHLEKNFRDPYSFRWITKGLFYEHNYGEDRTTSTGKDFTCFTLKDVDHTAHGKQFVSLKRLYLETEDPTEYEFATKHLGGWDHWKALCACSWFEEYIEAWRAELQLKLQSRALKNLMFEAENNGKNAYDANKFLIAKGYLPKETKLPGKRGRPSKEEVKAEAQKQVELIKRLEEDKKRLEIN